MKRTISGKVIRGTGEARKFGFPTVNIKPDETITDLTYGVYAGHLKKGEEIFPGVVYIGPRFSPPHELTCEIHCFSVIEIEEEEKVVLGVLGFIREAKKFPTSSELQEQVKNDISEAKRLVESL